MTPPRRRPSALFLSVAAATRKLGKGGKARLLRAQTEGRVTLTGRRLVGDLPGERQTIPPAYFADRIRLDVRTSCAGPKGTSRVFRRFESDLALAQWVEIRVAACQLAALVEPSPANSEDDWRVKSGETQKSWIFRPEVEAEAELRAPDSSKRHLGIVMSKMALECGVTWPAGSITSARRKGGR